MPPTRGALRRPKLSLLVSSLAPLLLIGAARRVSRHRAGSSVRSAAWDNAAEDGDSTDDHYDVDCGGESFTISEGARGGTSTIVVGMKDWAENIRNGSWGGWLQDRWGALEAEWQGLNTACRQNPGCARMSTAMFRDGSEEEEEATQASEKTEEKRKWATTKDEGPKGPPPQVQESWKLFKIVFLQYAPELLGSEALPEQPVPELIASFGPGGEMQGLGKIAFDEENTEVYFPLAVTRYTLSYAVKGKNASGARKGAGKAMMGGWMEERSSDFDGNDLALHTLPASTFVRKYYIDNGGTTNCDANTNQTNDDCAEMMKKGKNCDCEVRMCIKSKCIWYYQAGMCGNLGMMASAAVLKGCVSATGKFVGTCPIDTSVTD